MKLSISNIIWEKGIENLETFFHLVSKQGLSHVELALNCFWEEPVEASQKKISQLKDLLNKYQLNIASLHSLTFTREDLELFGTKVKRKELSDYLKRYLDLSHELDVPNIVYGSPKSRKRNGLSVDKCNQIFLDFLGDLDSYKGETNINIEPLPKSYCEYLNTFIETVQLLKNRDWKNIFIQLDVRSIIESQENIKEIFSYHEYIKHCHVGDPGLRTPGLEFKDIHQTIRNELANCDYKGVFTAEVIAENPNNRLKESIYCINRLKEYYY